MQDIQQKWNQLSLTVLKENVDEIQEILEEWGALTVTVTANDSHVLFQLAPDDRPLWDTCVIQALFDEEVSLDPLLAKLNERYNQESCNYKIETIVDKDWVKLTQENFQPQQYHNKLWIIPSWSDNKNYQGAVLKINPGHAFGTGQHPTTALCLEWLAKNISEPVSVIDFGCGSGILGLAALALGAKEVWFIDHDEQALLATENNVKLNPFFQTKKIHLLSSTSIPTIQAPLVVANILANPLIELAGLLSSLVSSQGKLVLSGILKNEISRVIDAYSNLFNIGSLTVQDNWVRILLIKRR